MATSHSTARNLAGMRFGKLTVIERAPDRPGNSCAIWRCICDCGNEKLKSSHDLKRAHAPSCGCWGRERISAAVSTHRRTKSKEYYCWAGIKQRCSNPKNLMYRHYGGRGIRICDRWSESFEAFLEDMGFAPPGTSIDRIDNDGDYEPGNCRWTTRDVQGKNRRGLHPITVRGETHLMAEWGRIAGVRRGTIANRLRWGWSEEEAIFGKDKAGSIPS